MALTELMVRQAKPEEKTYMMTDGHGLGLEIRPDGKKYWVIRYWVNKKEHRSSAGVYPGVTLKEAREKNAALRKSLKDGRPIGFERETFSSVAEEWMEKRMIPKCADSYLRTLRLRLKRLIIPHIGHMKLFFPRKYTQVNTIKWIEILKLLFFFMEYPLQNSV
jgi:hypothetical protein